MMNSANQLLLIAIVSVLINAGSCIKCYNCISTMNKDCLNPSDHPELKPQECNSELMKNLSSQVKKYASSFGAAIGLDIDKQTKQLDEVLVCQKVESVVQGENVVIRSCQLNDMSTTQLDSCKAVKKQTEGTMTHCSLCKEDGCNSAHWVSPLFAVAILMPAVVVALTTLMF